MTDDIVAWLRHEERSWDDNFGPGGGDVFKRAADEIERMQAENAELRERQRQVMRSAMGVYQRHGEPAPEREPGVPRENDR